MLNILLESIEDINSLEKVVIKIACEIMEEIIRELENQLYINKPARLDVIGFRSKTIVTKLGEIKIKRRLYREKITGEYVFLLDKKLGIRKGKRISGEYFKLIVNLASILSYRQTAKVVRESGFPSISHGTIFKEVREFGERESKKIEEEREKIFKEGQIEPQGKKEVPLLFVEADGIMVGSQEKGERRLEIKLGVMHEGWEYETPAKKRRRLKSPKIVSGVYKSSEEFWEELSSEIAKEYDLTNTKVILNGDGASWIQDGAKDYFTDVVIQLDRFHIKRDMRRYYGEEIADKFYEILAEGRKKVVIDTLESLIYEGETEKIIEGRKKLVAHLKRYEEHLLDYRYRIPDEIKKEIKLYGMGVAEGYVDKNIARRMKNQGMSWSRAGAEAMAKILMLKHNKKLKERLSDRYYTVKNPVKELKRQKKNNLKRDWGQWLQVSIPALKGPHAGREWVKALKNIAIV